MINTSQKENLRVLNLNRIIQVKLKCYQNINTSQKENLRENLREREKE